MYSVDCYWTEEGWYAEIQRHPEGGGKGELVWEKHGMKSEYHAGTAFEAALKKLKDTRGKEIINGVYRA